jgi:uncharacterized protein YbjT (DUF2867 family)
MPGELNVVTGAFGYTGKEIARQLLASGKQVRTLTGRPDRPDPFAGRVPAVPFDFDKPDSLLENLRGARVLYNTYWIRFPHRRVTYERAVENTRTLFRAAREAGVERFVHLSIVNASEDSPLPYFKCKAILERELRDSGLEYAIVRPTVVFGRDGILINNIAWLLRRFPLFLVPGPGSYRLQPVAVEDVAELAVGAGAAAENLVLDAAGPETYSFDELVRLIARTVASRARIIHAAPGLVLFLTSLVGKAVGDVILTRDELRGLMTEVLVSSQPALGRVTLSEWLAANAELVGASYQSELDRHYRPALRKVAG